MRTNPCSPEAIRKIKEARKMGAILRFLPENRFGEVCEYAIGGYEYVIYDNGLSHALSQAGEQEAELAAENAYERSMDEWATPQQYNEDWNRSFGGAR